jgi:hypothetical protein
MGGLCREALGIAIFLGDGNVPLPATGVKGRVEQTQHRAVWPGGGVDEDEETFHALFNAVIICDFRRSRL